jgi:hypothetical protein
MKITNKAGMRIEVCEERGLLINGKTPGKIETLGNGWFKASSIFCRVKRPKKVQGQRKRKLALMAATKRFRFSFNFKRD